MNPSGNCSSVRGIGVPEQLSVPLTTCSSHNSMTVQSGITMLKIYGVEVTSESTTEPFMHLPLPCSVFFDHRCTDSVHLWGNFVCSCASYDIHLLQWSGGPERAGLLAPHLTTLSAQKEALLTCHLENIDHLPGG